MVTISLRAVLLREMGYFDDNSMLRRVHRERALALSGPRALLMQAAHPLAVSGLLAHSSAMDEPYDRLARTAEVMSTIGFGTRADADRVTTTVRAMHARVRGTIKRAGGQVPRRDALPSRPARPAAVGPVHAGGLGHRRLPQVRGLDVACRGGRVLGRLQGRRRSVRTAALRHAGHAGRPGRLPARDARGGHAPDHRLGPQTARARSCWSRRCPGWPGRCSRPPTSSPSRCCPTASATSTASPPCRRPPCARLLVAGGAEYVKRAVMPFLPDRLRLVPAARAA